MKLCECGCGQFTNIPQKSNAGRGWIKGQPLRFVTGHNSRLQVAGPTNRNQYGYISVQRKLVHIAVVEKVLGHPLPEGAVVHHVDEDRANNDPRNLVACQDQAYHGLLHARMRALQGCGDPNARRCVYCRRWDQPQNLVIRRAQAPRHRDCQREQLRLRRERLKDATKTQRQAERLARASA